MKEFTDIVGNARSSDVDLKFLKKMTEALWEKSHKKVQGKLYSPQAVVFIDANSSPDRIVPYLKKATASKVCVCLFSGLWTRISSPTVSF